MKPFFKVYKDGYAKNDWSLAIAVVRFEHAVTLCICIYKYVLETGIKRK